MMTRQRIGRGAALALVATLAAGGLTAGQPARGARTAASRPPMPSQQGLEEFERRLDAYLQLRRDLARKLDPLSSTADAAELSARQARLAAAVRAARSRARQGDLITAPVAALISQVVAADFRRRGAKTEKAALDEVPRGYKLEINRTYPAEAALATIPPLLLKELPPLPDNLQYGFFGRHLVILDGDLQMVLDYVPNALPPH